jgi:uncharacterized membrane protein YhiD involved in acid resistance
MPDWWNQVFNEIGNGSPVDLQTLSRRLAAALLFGWAIALTHRFTQGRRDDFRPSFGVTLVMLTVILALITQVIGGNAARAFTLVGALAIVRFRTRVNDTRDTAYVILAVAIGMAVGLGYYGIALLGIPAVGLAAVLLPYLGFRRPRVERYLLSQRCDATESAEKGAVLDISYSVRLRDPSASPALVRELLNTPGIKAAEVKRAR